MFLMAGTEKAKGYRVFDKATGLEIHRVKWAEDKNGIYAQFDLDENGNLILESWFGQLKKTIKKGNIELRKVLQ